MDLTTTVYSTPISKFDTNDSHSRDVYICSCFLGFCYGGFDLINKSID